MLGAVQEANQQRSRHMAQQALEQADISSQLAAIAKTGADRTYHIQQAQAHTAKALRICQASGIIITPFTAKDVFVQHDEGC